MAATSKSWEGHPLDGWNWQKTGPVFQGLQDHRAPALAVVDGTLWLTFAQVTSNVMSLQVATSTNGVDWTDPVPVTGIAPSGGLYPTVLHDGAGFKMWVGSGSFDYAESADGIEWTVANERVITAGGSDAFDGLSVLYPSVHHDNDGYRMLYTGFSGTGFAIGSAWSTDGLTWEKGGVVLEPETGFDNTSVAQSSLVQTEAGWLAWYGGYDTVIADPGPWRIGLAHSDDGLAWTKDGISLPLAKDGFDAWSTRDPAVVRWDGGWLMVYVGMGDDGVYRLMSARSAVCP